MFDIGLPEFAVIAIVALLVFGPERLPQAAAQAGRFLRQLREAAATAREQMSQAAGFDDGEIGRAVEDLRSLDPRRLLDSPQSPGSPHGSAGPDAGVRPARSASDTPPPTPDEADPDWI